MTIPASGPTPTQPPSPPQTAPPSVSLVICTQHRPYELRQCLQALQRLTTRPSEVLVVDNTAGDPATEEAACSAGARYVVEPVSGLSRARNTALAASTSEIVAFIDDDARPEPDWLEHILEPFSDPAVAVVTGKVQTPASSGNDPESALLRRISSREHQWFEMVTFGGLGLGSNMAIRRSACPPRPLFDVRLGRGAPFQIAEESFAFAVLIDRGFEGVFTSAARVCHPPMRRANVEQETRNSLVYWMLLFAEFPRHRTDLIRFLLWRLRRKPLTWPRDPQGPGEIVSAPWSVKLKAALAAFFLFLRTPRS